MLSMSTPSSLEYNWSPPRQPNGPITAYILIFQFNNGSQSVTEQLSSNTTSFTLNNLFPYQLVTLNISAITTGGTGPAQVLTHRTNEYSK